MRLECAAALALHTRRAAAHAKGVLTNFRADEYPDDDHFSIGVNSMQRIFDFFDEQRKRHAVEGAKDP